MTKRKNKKVRPISPGKWIEVADLTYISCRTLFLTKHPYLWFDAAYLLHQAIEKYLKALLSSINENIWGHDLLKLSREAKNIYPDLETATKGIKALNKFKAFRYPDIPFKGEGLGEEEFYLGDRIIKLIRRKIPSNVVRKGLNKVITLTLDNLHLIVINILLKDNPEADFWKHELGLENSQC